MKYTYSTDAEVCSSAISIEVNDSGIIRQVAFTGGCPGSLDAVCKLVVGKKHSDAAKILSGIRCGSKSTSCPDQLAKALQKIKIS